MKVMRIAGLPVEFNNTRKELFIMKTIIIAGIIGLNVIGCACNKAVTTAAAAGVASVPASPAVSAIAAANDTERDTDIVLVLSGGIEVSRGEHREYLKWKNHPDIDVGSHMSSFAFATITNPGYTVTAEDRVIIKSFIAAMMKSSDVCFKSKTALKASMFMYDNKSFYADCSSPKKYFESIRIGAAQKYDGWLGSYMHHYASYIEEKMHEAILQKQQETVAL
jgi:hypothetical protein